MSIASNSAIPGRVNFGWFAQSFAIFQRDAGTWVAAVIITGIPSFAVSVAFNAKTYLVTLPVLLAHHVPPPDTPNYPIQFLEYGVNLLVTSFFCAGLNIMANKAVRDQPVRIRDLFFGPPLIFTTQYTSRFLAAGSDIEGRGPTN